MLRKAKTVKHKGIYQKDPGSGIWWVRWVDANGCRRALSAVSHATAVILFDEKQLERSTAQVLPVNPHREVTLKEVVEISVKYSETAGQSDSKGFKHRAGPKDDHWPGSRCCGKSFISTDLLIDVSS